MEKLQLLLEQDLGKIIVAIVILIIILVVIIIFANISNKRKKAMLENTRTLHKEEFEKAAKKRMELTQTISRDEIKKELAAPKKSNIEHTLVSNNNEKTVSEKTQELNLESVRRKLMQDERNNNAPKPVNLDNLEKEEPVKVEAVKKEEPKETVDIFKEELISEIKEEKPVVVEEPVIDEVVLKEELDVIENVDVDNSIVDIDEFDNLHDEDLFDTSAFEMEDQLNDITSFDMSDADKELDNILAGSSLENVNLDDEEIDKLLSDSENYDSVEFDVWDDNFGLMMDDAVVDPILEEPVIEDVPEVKIDVWAEDFGFEKSEVMIEPDMVNFDDEEIESDSASLFLAVSSVSASEKDLSRGIEFVDVEDQSVYVNSFDFGNTYYKDITTYDNSGVVLFDFGLTVSEELKVEEKYNPIFGIYNDCDYTYEAPEHIADPIFNNSVFEIGVEDIIDSTLTTAVATSIDEQLVVDSNANVEDITLAVEEEKVEEVDVFEHVTITNKELAPSFTVNTPAATEEYVVDVNSQLDKLGTYEMNLLDEYDFADENYNYNFNSINIMEEIVQDMFLDDFVEDNDDEYFKYIYQFALLDDVIDAVNLDVNLDDIGLSTPIVEAVSLELKEVAKTIEEDNSDDEELDLDVVSNLATKEFALDSELLNLTSLVLDHSNEEMTDDNKAYNPVVKTKKPSVLSPVFGADEDEEEIFEDEDTSLFDTELDLGNATDDKDVFELSDVEEEVTDVDAFVNMINEKIEETDDTANDEEDFLGVLKGLIKE